MLMLVWRLLLLVFSVAFKTDSNQSLIKILDQTSKIKLEVEKRMCKNKLYQFPNAKEINLIMVS